MCDVLCWANAFDTSKTITNVLSPDNNCTVLDAFEADYSSRQQYINVT